MKKLIIIHCLAPLCLRHRMGEGIAPRRASGGPASLLIKLILYIILFITSIDYLIILMPPAQITLLLPTGTLVDKLSIQCAEH